MAKVQGYFENNEVEHYSEGPWILCAHPMVMGLYRIEKLTRGLTFSIGAAGEDFEKEEAALRRHGLEIGWHSYEKLAPVVDELNGR